MVISAVSTRSSQTLLRDGIVSLAGRELHAKANKSSFQLMRREKDHLVGGVLRSGPTVSFQEGCKGHTRLQVHIIDFSGAAISRLHQEGISCYPNSSFLQLSSASPDMGYPQVRIHQSQAVQSDALPEGSVILKMVPYLMAKWDIRSGRDPDAFSWSHPLVSFTIQSIFAALFTNINAPLSATHIDHPHHHHGQIFNNLLCYPRCCCARPSHSH